MDDALLDRLLELHRVHTSRRHPQTHAAGPMLEQTWLRTMTVMLTMLLMLMMVMLMMLMMMMSARWA